MTESSSTVEAVDLVLGAGAREGVRHTNIDGDDKNTEIPEQCVRGGGGRGAVAGVRVEGAGGFAQMSELILPLRV